MKETASGLIISDALAKATIAENRQRTVLITDDWKLLRRGAKILAAMQVKQVLVCDHLCKQPIAMVKLSDFELSLRCDCRDRVVLRGPVRL